MKKFEMKNYEVEEMSQQELVDVSGGLDPITVLGVTFTIIGAVATVWQLAKDGPTGYHTVEFRLEVGEEGYVVVECGMHEPHRVYGAPGQIVRVQCSWPVRD